MSIYSDWRSDKPAIGISALTLLATLAAPFFSTAMAGQPWWVNLLIAVAIFVLGGITALLRLRLVARSMGSVPNERGEDEPSTAQLEPTAVEEPPTGRWEVVEESIRKALVVTGEGPIILIWIRAGGRGWRRSTSHIWVPNSRTSRRECKRACHFAAN